MLKRIIDRLNFKSLTYKRKLNLSYMLISIIPALIIGFLSYDISRKVVIIMKSEMVEKELASAADRISFIISDIEDVTLSLYSNRYVQDGLKDRNLTDSYKISEVTSALSSISIDLLNGKKRISSIYIFGRNGVSYKSKSYDATLFEDYISCKEYIADNNITGLNKWFGSEKFRYSTNISYNIMNFKIIRDIATLDEIGAMVVSMDERYLCDIYGMDNSSSFIAEKSGKIISDLDKEKINSDIGAKDYFLKLRDAKKPTGSFIQEMDNNRYLLTYSKIEGVDWYLINFISYSSIVKESLMIKNLTLAVVIICLIISFVIAFLISRSLTASLMELKNLMNRVEDGNLDVRFMKKNNDEINILGGNFNSMVANIKNYMNEIEIQQKMKRISELKLMQAQINPHFLYNTLDSVQSIIEDGDLNRANKSMAALIKFFKISLSKGDVLIPVKQEIEHARSYVTIQNYCFEKNFVCDINVSREMLNYKIIKLTLQPVIENSIIHGFKNYREDGIIKIEAMNSPDGENIILTVEDNGMGIMEDEVRRLNAYLKNDNTENMDDSSKPFGIKNVSDRLRHTFGDDYGIEIESEFDSYTKVIIKIPKMLNEMAG